MTETAHNLRPFQRRFVEAATASGIDTAALSMPRGNGKSWLAARIMSRVLDPADRLFRSGTESVIAAASLEQGRIVFRFIRQLLEKSGEYRWLDSNTRIGAVHKATNTRLRVIGSNGKTAMGLVECPWVIADEPGAWEVNGGGLLHDAIETAKGKPFSPLRAIYIGTLAPLGLDGHWWHDLIQRGSGEGVHVTALQGDPKRWDDWNEIRRCNPLTAVSDAFRTKLLRERDEARRDERLKARFMSYRLNVPSGDESSVLLTVADWERVTARAVQPREGLPVVGVDLGGGRAWSSAVAVWPATGRVEAVAVAPGLPDIDAQEKRDRVPSGRYRRLVSLGVLRMADGLRVPPVSMLWEGVLESWGGAELVICDRFRLPELRDATAGLVPIMPRVSRWSESSADIRGLRKLAKDGPLSVEPDSGRLLLASLAVSKVTTDTSGNVRMVKASGGNNTARDDVAAALVLAAGEVERRRSAPAPSMNFFRPEQPAFDTYALEADRC